MMNKVILMGRLTRDPEVKYTQGNEPIAVAKYTIAVAKRFKKQGEAEADFINCIAFGKTGEFVEKYLSKGQMISLVGRLQVRTYDDKNGDKKWVTEVIVEEHHFAESKQATPKQNGNSNDYNPPINVSSNDGFDLLDDDDDDVPF